MKRLIECLQRFSFTSSEHTQAFSKMTLRDLGWYVREEEAIRYMKEQSYPIQDHVFELEGALQQRGSSIEASQVSPVAWKSSANDVLGSSTLYQNEVVTLCWFVIPPGKTLPLHDHPGMTVWQRVMHGRLHLCTIVGEAGTGASKVPIDGTVVFDGEIRGVGAAIPASDVLRFTPDVSDSSGMLHEIRNIDMTQPALLVDIISPPYDRQPSNIRCGYYIAEPLDATRRPLLSLAVDGGVRHQLKTGDRVRLHPRINYSGPAMDAFVRIE